MESSKQIRFSADAFIAWALDQPTGRLELDNGIVVAKGVVTREPERVSHTLSKAQAWLALRTAIAECGLACQALPEGVMVRIDDRTVYDPSALVRCGPLLPDDATDVADPIIVVEAVSPASRGIDRGVKLVGYFSLPSVRHYLIVDTAKRVVIHFHRDTEGRIKVDIVRDGQLMLDPPGMAIDVRDIF